MSTTPARRRILLPLINPASFIDADIATLRTRYDVTVMPCLTPAEMLGCALAMRTHDELFCWFGSLRFVLPVMAARGLGKRITVIAGGYDVADEPGYAYGNMQSQGWRVLPRALGRALFGAADRVVTYSQFASREAVAHALVDPARLRMLYLGIEARGGAPAPKAAMVLTVSIIDATTIHRKGLLTVARVSRLLPDVPFVIAGRQQDRSAVAMLQATAGPNLTMPGFVSDGELRALYQRAKVYLQPSLHEAFGVSVAEAMVYRAIPVVAPRGSLPEVVGETGFYAEPEDIEGTAAAVRKALEGPGEGSEPARSRILSQFSADERRRALLELMESS